MTKTISTLGFSHLRIGQHLLGVIKSVNDFDLIVSLPNHLTGFVSCDRISNNLSQRLLQVAEENADDDDDEKASASVEIPTLSSMYATGDVVICTVAAVNSASKGEKNQKRRLELSLRPEHVNKGLSLDTMASNMIVAGEILSREDRGFSINLGPLDSTEQKQHVFLPDASIPEEKRSSFVIGKTVPLRITSSFDMDQASSKNQRVITLAACELDLSAMIPKSLKVSDAALRCGSLVSARISAILPDGLQVSFHGHVTTVHIDQLSDRIVFRPSKQFDLTDFYELNQSLKLRVVFADYQEKVFELSSHLVAWSSSDVTTVEDKKQTPKTGAVIPKMVGQKIEECTVVRVIPKLGVLVAFNQSENDGEEEEEIVKQHAFVHISRLSDEHLDGIDKTYHPGTTHRIRLLDYDYFAQIYIASMQESVWKESILRCQDINPGMLVTAKVASIEPFGLVVAITDRIRAVCPLAHLTEEQTLLKDPSRLPELFNVGQKYKFRVLDCNPTSRRITVTRKKGLVDSNMPILSSFDQAKPDAIHDGFIAALKPFGAIVRFFGDNVKGIVTIAELTDDFVDHPQDSYFVGQVVRARIIKCDPQTRAMTLSLRKQTGPKKRPSSDLS